MTDSSRNLLVGVFVLLAFVVLGTLLAWFGEAPEWLGGNEWTLQITDVRDLRGVDPGCPVQLFGVEIGRVRELSFLDPTRPANGVVVISRIKDQYAVPQNSTARVFGATLGFGTGHIEIIVPPGVGDRVLEKDGSAQIRGEMRSLIGELISKDMVDSVQRVVDNFATFAQEATPVAQNLARLLEERPSAKVDAPGSTTSPNLATVVERLDALVANLNVVLGDVNVQGDVRAVVHSLRASADELKETVHLWKTSTERIAENVNTGIDRTEENLDRSFAKLNNVLDNLDDGSGDLARAMHEVAEGRGTAGLIVRDERLYEAAVLSLERFADAMNRFQAILARIEEDGYINLGLAPSGILKTKVPVATQASETP